MNLLNTTISEHVMERYAERIRGRDKKADIKEFVANNSEKIKKDISKMLEYGTEIYSGPGNMTDKSKNQIIRLFNKDAWFILLSEDNAVITLFKKDFGFGDENYNKDYAKRVVARIEELAIPLQQAKNVQKEKSEAISESISDNEAEIVRMRKIIKQIEETNEGLRLQRNNLNINFKDAEEELIEFIHGVLGKKVFGY